MRPKGVTDGHPVNIPDLLCVRYHDGVTQKDKQVVIWLWRLMRVSWFWQANPPGLNSEAQNKPVWDSAADFTLPRKTSKENKGNRTPNRHR